MVKVLRRQCGAYRVYFVRRGEVLLVVLCGGDKACQVRDITRAKALAKEIDE